MCDFPDQSDPIIAPDSGCVMALILTGYLLAMSRRMVSRTYIDVEDNIQKI